MPGHFFTSSSELQPAVNLWISDVSSAISTYGEINTWDVTQITNMDNLFRDKITFNSNISNWNVHNVTSMYQMFYNATNFNQDIGNWNVHNVTSINSMFQYSSFNQDISGWNVHNVRDMNDMFFNNSSFNQPLNNWNVHNVTTMATMFEDSPFNQPLNNWNVNNVTSMSFMFVNTNFNQPLNNWNVHNVTSMLAMFKDSSFNQNISTWNVNNVTNMYSIFNNSSLDPKYKYPIANSWFDALSTTAYNQLIDSFNTLNETNIIGFFGGANNDKYVIWNVHPDHVNFNQIYIDISNSKYTFLDNSIVPQDGYNTMFDGTDLSYIASVVQNFVDIGMIPPSQQQPNLNRIGFIGNNSLSFFDTSNLSTYGRQDVSRNPLLNINANELDASSNFFFILNNTKPEPEEPINNVNICFPRDTPVITDQGSIMIQNIDKTNTLNGKKVVAVTESIPLDEMIVVIEKDALFKNMPSRQTKISLNHRVLFKGEMVKASELVNKVEGAYYEKYNKEILYNVLLDTHEKMIVNNLICETLDPENMVALLYKNRSKMSNKKYSRLVGEINKTVKDRDMLSFIKIGKRLLAM